MSVVNSYPAAKENVPVSFVSNVDFPTDGKPIRPTLVSPDLLTSNPLSPAPPPFLLAVAVSKSSRLSLLSFAFNKPRCVSVALFF